MKVRFQADADLKQAIVIATKRREPAIDFQTADEANLKAVEDPEVLLIAAREGRLLVSHDRRTMPHHFAQFIRTNVSPGLLIASQHIPVAAVVENLVLIWTVTEAEEWTNQIKSLPL